MMTEITFSIAKLDGVFLSIGLKRPKTVPTQPTNQVVVSKEKRRSVEAWTILTSLRLRLVGAYDLLAGSTERAD